MVLFVIILSMILLSGCSYQSEEDFNYGWKFARGTLIGAEATCYDDSAWEEVDLPHDFSMDVLPCGKFMLGIFSREAKGGGSTAYIPGGTGWYRKHFCLPRVDAGKSVTLVFDGAYMQTDVWVNGHHVANHNNGYTPFSLDITGQLSDAGKENVIAVKVANEGRNSRWYSGSGLYRDVALFVDNPLHFAQWGTFVTTPQVSSQQATVHLDLTVNNDSGLSAAAELRVRLLTAEGEEVENKSCPIVIQSKSSVVTSLDFSLDTPSLWSVDTPTLYTAEVQMVKNGRQIDLQCVRFGIRKIEVNAEEGFKINGEPILLKGGCVHHDNGLLGAAAFRTAEYRRVRQLKEAGFNAVRCAHNPPSRHFLDACDDMGLLVIDEFSDMWELPKNTDDYSRFFKDNWENDLTSMILRDRNHPSVVIWSIGNEIPNWSVNDASRIGQALAAKVRELDSTRFVTQAVTSAFIHIDWDNSAETFKHLDIAGYNYLTHYIEGDHSKYPERVIIGTESYPGSAWAYWNDVLSKPYVIGDFVWTALDHLGEAGIGSSRYVPVASSKKKALQFQTSPGPCEGTNPAIAWQAPEGLGPELPTTYVNNCGDIDLIGDKKPQGRYRDVLWDRSAIEILVHEPLPAGMIEEISSWGWPREEARWCWPGHEGEKFQVRVFSKAPQVRLELDGETVDVQKTDGEYVAMFGSVEYRPGRLTAVSMDDQGRDLSRVELCTPGKPSSVRIIRETENIDNDLIYLKVEIVDNQGLLVPVNVPVQFLIQGAELMSSGNGSPDDMASFRSCVPSTWNGAAMLIVRPSGADSQVDVSVLSDGLNSGHIVVSR